MQGVAIPLHETDHGAVLKATATAATATTTSTTRRRFATRVPVTSLISIRGLRGAAASWLKVHLVPEVLVVAKNFSPFAILAVEVFPGAILEVRWDVTVIPHVLVETELTCGLLLLLGHFLPLVISRVHGITTRI